jgi:ubiquinone/menaquinone biosynthesis C-methylase UbiE
MEQRTDFDKMASQWDQNPLPVKISQAVSDAILRETTVTQDRDVLDFGCGTGLLTLKLQPFVRAMTGADGSDGMLSILRKKVERAKAKNVSTQLVDFENGGRVRGMYDLVVSSMTMHHIKDTDALLRHWKDLLVPGGQVCFADLDTEDGSFHSDNTGVFHFGFDRRDLKKRLLSLGFQDVRDLTATSVVRETGARAYPVFLVIARK